MTEGLWTGWKSINISGKYPAVDYPASLVQPPHFVGPSTKKEHVAYVVRQAQPMDIVVCRYFRWWQPWTWSSRAIRVSTGSQWSHTFVVGEEGSCYTTDLKFRRGSLANELLRLDAWAVYRLPGLTVKQKAAGCLAATGEVGKVYPYLDPFSMWVQNLFNPGSYKLKVDNKNMICSQCVGWLFRNIMGVDPWPQLVGITDLGRLVKKDISMLTPDDMADSDLLQEIGAWP